MLKNKAKIFATSTMNHYLPIDAQINDYLELHKDYRIVDVSYILAGTFEKALVVFSFYVPDKNEEPGKAEPEKREETRKVVKKNS